MATRASYRTCCRTEALFREGCLNEACMKFAGASISCNDISMKVRLKASNSQLLLRTLAEFRYELRKFLHFSENAAVEAGLQPQQHQLLLQVTGAPDGEAVTIAYAAERLSLRHHSVVELVNRSEREGLLTRTVDTRDRRRAILELTRKGELSGQACGRSCAGAEGDGTAPGEGIEAHWGVRARFCWFKTR